MEPEDHGKIEFCTPDGLFKFKVMPFGLCNAPATFQQLMDLVLAGLQWSSCLVYLDDTVLTQGRYSTDPGKTEKVRNWPIPTNRCQVQQFLCLVSYYQRFVQDFAKTAKPLHRLTEKTNKFEWTRNCQEAFNDLRLKLVSATILAFPDYTKPFTLDTDASNTGVGVVLSQLDDNGAERVVAYASRTISWAERRYCVTRKELLAVVTSLKHFRPYLLGRHIILRTDHGSLTWLA